MAILNVTSYPPGLVDVRPSVVYIETNDTVATVTTTGYLNKKVQQGFVFEESMMALVSTKTAPNATVVSVGWYDISKSGENWSLVPTITSITLPDGMILVGSATDVATPVAMSGDITIDNAGVTAIGAAKVLLAMLAPGITPSHVIKFANQVTTAGGAPAEAITVTGAVAATDRAFVQVVNDGTANVTVLQAVVTNNTLTVTFSADPGADTIINYQIIRAAS